MHARAAVLSRGVFVLWSKRRPTCKAGFERVSKVLTYWRSHRFSNTTRPSSVRQKSWHTRPAERRRINDSFSDEAAEASAKLAIAGVGGEAAKTADSDKKWREVERKEARDRPGYWQTKRVNSADEGGMLKKGTARNGALMELRLPR